MFNYLLGYVFEDFPGAGLVALVDQQVVGQIVGRSPEAGAAAQGTDSKVMARTGPRGNFCIKNAYRC